MKNWINDKLLLSYYPNLFWLALNSGILFFNLRNPSCLNWVSNLCILSGSIGITVSIRELYLNYKFKKEMKEFQRRIDDLP